VNLGMVVDGVRLRTIRRYVDTFYVDFMAIDVAQRARYCLWLRRDHFYFRSELERERESERHSKKEDFDRVRRTTRTASSGRMKVSFGHRSVTSVEAHCRSSSILKLPRSVQGLDFDQFSSLPPILLPREAHLPKPVNLT